MATFVASQSNFRFVAVSVVNQQGSVAHLEQLQLINSEPPLSYADFIKTLRLKFNAAVTARSFPDQVITESAYFFLDNKSLYSNEVYMQHQAKKYPLPQILHSCSTPYFKAAVDETNHKIIFTPHASTITEGAV